MKIAGFSSELAPLESYSDVTMMAVDPMLVKGPAFADAHDMPDLATPPILPQSNDGDMLSEVIVTNTYTRPKSTNSLFTIGLIFLAYLVLKRFVKL